MGPFTVTPFAVNHPVEEAYALRVEVTEPDKDGAAVTRVLTYSGDTDSCRGLEEAAKDADLFLCEAAFEEGRDDGIKDVHLTGKRAGEAATAAGARRLLLTHIPVWTRRPRSWPRHGRSLPGRGRRRGGRALHRLSARWPPAAAGEPGESIS